MARELPSTHWLMDPNAVLDVVVNVKFPTPYQFPPSEK
jgi:hypothetical protein